MTTDAVTRRQFLSRFAGVGLTAAALATVPDVLKANGWYEQALAQEADVTLDTFNALAAMVWPGDDAYSVAQGETFDGPGAIAAEAGRLIKEALDFFVPAPDGAGSNDETLRISDATALAINNVAMTVSPGQPVFFPSHFARLSYADKLATWQRLEEDTREADVTGQLGVLQLLFGLLPGFVQFFGFSEGAVWDAASGTATARPVGWEHAGYLPGRTTGVEGHDELIGYWQGRTAADA